jgi:DNA-binding response OmpR family regulator
MPPHLAFRPRVLLIDDPERPPLRCHLEGWGYRVVKAADGAAGFQSALCWNPEAVIVGVDVPPLGGYAVGRGLRAVFGPGILLIARAAPGQLVDRYRAFAAGFDDVLDGDAAPGDLQALLAVLLGATSVPEPGRAGGST